MILRYVTPIAVVSHSDIFSFVDGSIDFAKDRRTITLHRRSRKNVARNRTSSMPMSSSVDTACLVEDVCVCVSTCRQGSYLDLVSNCYSKGSSTSWFAAGFAAANTGYVAGLATAITGYATAFAVALANLISNATVETEAPARLEAIVFTAAESKSTAHGHMGRCKKHLLLRICSILSCW